MLAHVDHICSWLHGRDVVFMGDGDAVGLALMHLAKREDVAYGPRSMHLLDFDERMVESVRRFARYYDLEDRVSATLYNVRLPVPADLRGKFSAFHTNPPYGKSNGGRSVEIFIRRAIEACGDDCNGCVVLGDDDALSWTQEVLAAVQQSVVSEGFMISELKPKAHQYHLDDAPELTSCTMLLRRMRARGEAGVRSIALADDECADFYGREQPLRVQCVKDFTAGGRFPSRDHEIVWFDDAPGLFD